MIKVSTLPGFDRQNDPLVIKLDPFESQHPEFP